MRNRRSGFGGNDSTGATSGIAAADPGTASKKRGRPKKAAEDTGAPPPKKPKTTKTEVVELEDDEEVEEGEIQSGAGKKEGEEELGVNKAVKKEAETSEEDAASPKMQSETDNATESKAGIGMDKTATDMENDKGSRGEIENPGEAMAVVELDGDDAW